MPIVSEKQLTSALRVSLIQILYCSKIQLQVQYKKNNLLNNYSNKPFFGSEQYTHHAFWER